MPKLGAYTYPDVKLSRALEVAETISRDFKGQVSVSGLATRLEMAERGGGFIQIVAGLRGYGLADGRKELAITPLAESIIYADSENDAAKARAKAFFGVELFRKMWEKIGSDAPAEARLRAVLQEITRESLTGINSRLSTVRTVWMDGMQLVRGATPDAPGAAPETAYDESLLIPGVAGKAGAGEFIEFKANGSYVRVRKSLSDVDFAIKLLEVVRDELSVRQTGPKAPRVPSPPASA